jgi:hypothetical protein
MIIRAAALGFLLWLLATLAFRFLGHYVLFPTSAFVTPLLVLTPFLMVGVTWAAIKLIRVAAGDEAEAAIGLAFPGMLLDAFVMRNFSAVFPNLDAGLDGEFGAILILGYGAVLFTGLLLTKIAPSDERL